ncbi:MAG TPA: cytochrome c oxidase assembly protein [Acidimicrobiia bacterium]|nr:cytochrome c oxidase assembly protein [Acidimicrobiia bacterium]
MADLGALTPVGVVAVLYAIGLTRAHVDAGRRWAGWSGIVALAVALGPPIDVWAATNLSAHMVQHVVLLTIAPPLLVVGLAPETILAVSPRAQELLAPFARAFRRAPLLVWTAAALALQTAALGLWHVPSIYDAAATHAPLHAAEHLSFVLTGVAFWWLVARAGTGAAVITIFLASLPGTLLGALLTLSTATWYPHYATGSPTAALQDQQLAGVVMWAVAGMAYVAAGAVLFVMWLRALERRSPARVTVEAIR